MSAIVYKHFKVCDDVAEMIDRQIHKDLMKDVLEIIEKIDGYCCNWTINCINRPIIPKYLTCDNEVMCEECYDTYDKRCYNCKCCINGGSDFAEWFDDEGNPICDGCGWCMSVITELL